MIELEEQIGKAGVLLEALPYMQAYRGKTVLIKVGGSAMDDPELVRKLLRDVVFLEAVGINPVIVHGGGKAISQAMKEAGLEPTFVGGLRVTDAATIGIVEQTLGNVINPSLVESVNRFGGQGVGVRGQEVFVAERATGVSPETGEVVELGFTGKVTAVHAYPVMEVIQQEKVPVVSPLGREGESGQALNVNADLAASALAAELRCEKLIYMSDVQGVMEDPADAGSLISTLKTSELDGYVEGGVISGGMIPKVRSAADALAAGVGKVHMIDGRIPHSLILEVFTDVGIGTQMMVE